MSVLKSFSVQMYKHHSRIFKKVLTAYKLYLKEDYRLGLSNTSSCPDHCIAFALSDLSNSRLQTFCSHKHDGESPRCEAFYNCLKYLKESVYTAEGVCKYNFLKLLSSIKLLCRFSCRIIYHLCVHYVYITLNKISIIFDVMYIFTDVPSDIQCELLNDIDVAGQFVLSWKGLGPRVGSIYSIEPCKQ